MERKTGGEENIMMEGSQDQNGESRLKTNEDKMEEKDREQEKGGLGNEEWSAGIGIGEGERRNSTK